VKATGAIYVITIRELPGAGKSTMLDPHKWATYANNPAAFRADLMIDRSGKSVCLGDALDPWQNDDFRAMDGAWLACVGRGDDYAGRMNAWLVRPRGHSKTSDQAVMAAWALSFAPRLVRGVAAAADRDQSRLLRDAILQLVKLNPWLSTILEVQAYVVRNVADGHPGCHSTIEIISSDSQSAYGLLIDFCLCDEPTHWSAAAEELWVALFSATGKRKNVLFCAILNAGFKSHWSYRVNESVKEDPAWYFHHLDGYRASWTSPAAIERMRRLLPAIQAGRLIDNKWSDETGQGLPATELRRTVCLAGPVECKPASIYGVAIGLDIGISRDNASLVAVGWNVPRQKLVLLDNTVFSPSDYTDGEVRIADIETEILDYRRRFDANSIASDAWQAKMLLQRLANMRLFTNVIAIQMSAKSKTAQAKALLECLRDGILELYPGHLSKDLDEASVIERLAGVAIVSPRNERGHGDSLSALSVLLEPMLSDLRILNNAVSQSTPPPPSAIDSDGLRGALFVRDNSEWNETDYPHVPPVIMRRPVPAET
jgi:hypothetical protein